jgi:hypothetical protein
MPKDRKDTREHHDQRNMEDKRAAGDDAKGAHGKRENQPQRDARNENMPDESHDAKDHRDKSC